MTEGYDKDKMYERKVNLYLEANPNPNSLKFVANFMLFPQDVSFDYPDLAAAEKQSPLAAALFGFDYVQRVFLMNNFVTITKKEEVAWEEIRNELKEFITEYIEAEKPLLNEDLDTESTLPDDSNDSESVKRIKDILEEYVKPAVETDGGAIVFDSYEDGIVKLQLQGSCSGCPSSTLTLKAGIENLLKSMMPEVQAVEAESV